MQCSFPLFGKFERYVTIFHSTMVNFGYDIATSIFSLTNSIPSFWSGCVPKPVLSVSLSCSPPPAAVVCALTYSIVTKVYEWEARSSHLFCKDCVTILSSKSSHLVNKIYVIVTTDIIHCPMKKLLYLPPKGLLWRHLGEGANFLLLLLTYHSLFLLTFSVAELLHFSSGRCSLWAAFIHWATVEHLHFKSISVLFPWDCISLLCG